MLTLILLTSDTKLSGQIELWVRQFLGDRARAESYKSLEEYKAMLEKALEDPETQRVQAAAVAGKPAGDSKDRKKVRIFVVDLELINNKPSAWIADLQSLTAEKGKFLLGDTAPKVLIMGFDGGPYRLDSLQHDLVDDLILKPVDRSLFLQKAEYLLSDDPKLSPTFLFRAKTQQIVEVGRDVVIDEISEFAVSVRSPGPVPDGSFASIHAEVFGKKGERRLIGRVYESVKHPVREGEYLVRFSYFAVAPEQISTVRRFIKANQTQMRTKTWGPPGASGPTGATGSSSAGTVAAGSASAKAGLSKELLDKMALLKIRKFAVIDMNLEILNETKGALETSFKGVSVRVFPSFARLANDLKNLAPDTTKVATAKPVVVTAAEKSMGAASDHALPGGRRLTLVIRSKTYELARFEPVLKKTDLVLGKSAQEWTDKPDQFVNAIDKEDREAFEEFISFVEAGTPGRVMFRSLDASGRTAFFEASGVLEKSGAGAGDGTALIRVDLKETDADHWNRALTAISGTPAGTQPKDPSLYRFEAIFIDSAFLRPDPIGWYERLVELLRKSKVLGPDDQPPRVFVLSDPKARAKSDEFRFKGIADFSFKPIDRRYMIQKFHAFFPTLALAREPEAPPFVPCEINAKLGKEVTMEEVSEYGLSILHPAAFREKSFMRFFSRLFGEEGEWVAGRSHFSEKLEGENYRCRFMFFGPADELTGRIRRWIREDYVAKKEKT